MVILRGAWFDIVVTAAITAAVFMDLHVLRWAVMIYTPFILLLKLAAFARRHSPSKFKPQDAGVPTIVYHILYALNAGILVLGASKDSEWWWVAGAWLLIWLLSAASGKGKPVEPTS
jgi:hypothetical protein